MGGGGQSKIYGVKFDGTNSVGTRLLGAKGLQFTPSNTTTAGIDDFITIEDSPFHIRECISDYSELTNKQRILAYEGDSNWNQLVEAKVGNRMIEFPKFWYKRPSKWEWYVSSEPFSGALPSPMHYRNGVMHDYVYVAKYAINSNYNSQTGETILTSTDLTTYRNNLRSYGMYVWDYALLCSLQILMLIKYNNTNFQSIIGKGDQSGGYSTGTADLIKGKDGCASNDITSNAGILCFAIENFYAKCWKTIDGVYRNGNSLYINTDIENITSNSTSGYVRIPTGVASPSGWAWITDISFDSTYPWAIFPTNYTSSPQDYNANPGTMIGDACWGNSRSGNMGWSCFGAAHGNACGPFSVASDNSFGFGYSNIGTASFFLSEDVTVPNSPKIYGVKFDGTNSTGTRLENSEGLRFTPSNTTTAGIDDFMADQNSPFAIRECISDYNSSTGKQEVIAYEGDSNWNTLVANKTGNRMIEFPKFYYKRPSKWEFYVSSDEKPGFLPSPMHYRNGKFHDKVYVSKFAVNEDGYSKIGYKGRHEPTEWKEPSENYSIQSFRNLLGQQKLYVVDYATFCSINMLLIIKYNSLDSTNVIGKGTVDPISGDSINILGKDGYSGTNKNDQATIICMGIENYFSGNHYFTNGICRKGNTVYVNTDIENINIDPSSSLTNWNPVNTPIVMLNYFGWISDISYDIVYPWMMFPTATVGNLNAGEVDWENMQDYGTAINDGCVIYTNDSKIRGALSTGAGYVGSGIFTLDFGYTTSVGYTNMSSLSMFLSESYT